MNRSFSKFSGALLLMVFAFFFASTNLFIHTHDGPYGKIVHSHPWGGKPHSHSTSQFQLISIVSNGSFDISDSSDHVEAPCTPVIGSEFIFEAASPARTYADAFSLRGPPMFV